MKSNRLFKISLITLIIGIVFISVGISLGGMEYVKNTNINFLSGKKLNKYHKEINNFKSMNIDFRYSNIEIKSSDDDKYYIEYYAENEQDYTISDLDENLNIDDHDNKNKNRKILNLDINFLKNIVINGVPLGNADKSLFILYVPEKKHSKIEINNEYGNVNIDKLNAESLKVNIDFGTLNLSNTTFENVELSNQNGEISVMNSIFDNMLNIENSKGSIHVKNIKSNTIEINQSMGAIDFSKIEAEKITMQNNMGDISGKISYDPTKNYLVTANSDLGSVSIDSIFSKRNDTKNIIDIKLKTNMGSITLDDE